MASAKGVVLALIALCEPCARTCWSPTSTEPPTAGVVLLPHGRPLQIATVWHTLIAFIGRRQGRRARMEACWCDAGSSRDTLSRHHGR